MTSRIEFPESSRYSNKVLVGPWVHTRLSYNSPEPQNVTLSSTYGDSYGPKLATKPHTEVWDQKIKSEDSNFIPQFGRNDFPNYFENFSSTYDLSFNHIPKCFKGHINRTLRFRLSRHEPNDDYISSYGNLTNHGLKEYKKEGWACDVPDPRKTISSHYRDTFISPQKKDYVWRRNAIPLRNSSIVNQVNVMGLTLKLRDKPMSTVIPPPEGLVTLPRSKHFNPITWEIVPEVTYCQYTNKNKI